MIRDDYNRFPGGGGGCPGIGSCACHVGGLNGPVHSLEVVLSPWAYKANNQRRGEGRGAMGVVCVFAVGAFTEYGYSRRVNGVNQSHRSTAHAIARFWNNGDGQTWLDEHYADHVRFDTPLAHLARTKTPLGQPEYGHIIVGHNSQHSTMTRNVNGYPNEEHNSHLHRLAIGRAGQEIDEAPPPPGETFRDTNWTQTDHGAGLNNNNIIRIDAGDDSAQQIIGCGFNAARVWDSTGVIVQEEFGSQNVHTVAWDEDGFWLVGSRRQSDFPESFPSPAELDRTYMDFVPRWAGFTGGGADANTTIITSGIYDLPDRDTELFQAIYWGRSLIYGGLDWSWRGSVSGEPSNRVGIMRVDRDGQPSPNWDIDIEAFGNGPVVYDIDTFQNVYFGGPVTAINGTQVDPWQIYRVDWQGRNEVQLGTVSGAGGTVLCAKVFASRLATPWDGASQLLIGGDFTHYQAREGSRFPALAASNHLAAVSIEKQTIPAQEQWPDPWSDGGEFEVGDFMPGLIW